MQQENNHIIISESQNKKYIIDKLSSSISSTIQKVKTKLFIISAAYDKFYKKYYITTLVLFILSSVVTFIEALRLIIIEYINKNETFMNEQILTTIVNVLVLSIGIVITILSSIIRFKNYREILEELREKQNIIIEYINKYVKQKNDLEFLYNKKRDEISYDDIEIIKQEIAEYDTKIESTNILQYLTTKDIIKYNKYKANFDYKLKEISIKNDYNMKDIPTKINKNKKQNIFISIYQKCFQKSKKDIQIQVSENEII